MNQSKNTPLSVSTEADLVICRYRPQLLLLLLSLMVMFVWVLAQVPDDWGFHVSDHRVGNFSIEGVTAKLIVIVSWLGSLLVVVAWANVRRMRFRFGYVAGALIFGAAISVWTFAIIQSFIATSAVMHGALPHFSSDPFIDVALLSPPIATYAAIAALVAAVALALRSGPSVTVGRFARLLFLCSWTTFVFGASIYGATDPTTRHSWGSVQDFWVSALSGAMWFATVVTCLPPDATRQSAGRILGPAVLRGETDHASISTALLLIATVTGLALSVAYERFSDHRSLLEVRRNLAGVFVMSKDARFSGAAIPVDSEWHVLATLLYPHFGKLSLEVSANRTIDTCAPCEDATMLNDDVTEEAAVTVAIYSRVSAVEDAGLQWGIVSPYHATVVCVAGASPAVCNDVADRVDWNWALSGESTDADAQVVPLQHKYESKLAEVASRRVHVPVVDWELSPPVAMLALMLVHLGALVTARLNLRTLLSQGTNTTVAIGLLLNGTWGVERWGARGWLLLVLMSPWIIYACFAVTRTVTYSSHPAVTSWQQALMVEGIVAASMVCVSYVAYDVFSAAVALRRTLNSR